MRRPFSLAICFLFLTSCVVPSPHWEIEETRTFNPAFSSAKAYLPSTNVCREVEAEIVRSCSGMRMYLNIHSLPFREKPHIRSKAELEVLIQGEKALFLVDILRGGQRLVLPNEAMTCIIQALLENHSVTLYVGRYATVLTPYSFAEIYNKLRCL